MEMCDIRDLYESRLGPSRDAQGNVKASNPGRARAGFVNVMKHSLGLCDINGKPYKDRCGNRVLRESTDAGIRAMGEDFRDTSFPELFESLVGQNTGEFARNPGKFVEWKDRGYPVDRAHPEDPRHFLEAPGVGLSPSAFADINAWTGTVTGLLERRLLEKVVQAEYIGDEICPDEQSKIAEGQKVIGISQMDPAAVQIRNPNEPHPRAQVGERWVTLPKTNEWALAIDVTFEAAFFDLTGALMEMAGQVGETVGYNKELRKIDALLAGSNMPWSTGLSTDACGFNYDGTKYNLYNTSANALGILNAQTGNGLIGGDLLTFQNSWLLFQRMYDIDLYLKTSGATKKRLGIMPDTVVCMPGAAMTADLIAGARDVQRRTTGGSTQSSAGTLTVQNYEGNPVGRFGVSKVLTSALLEQRAMDATAIGGLNLSGSALNNIWWHLKKGGLKNVVNWPLQTQQAPAASSYEMLDKRLIFSVFCSERSTPSVWYPQYIVQNKA